MLYEVITLGTFQDLEATANVSGVVEAFVGASLNTVAGGTPGAQIALSAPSSLLVQAYSDVHAKAETEGGGGGLVVSVAAYSPTAIAGGYTRAFAGDGANLGGHDLRRNNFV